MTVKAKLFDIISLLHGDVDNHFYELAKTGMLKILTVVYRGAYCDPCALLIAVIKKVVSD